MVVARTRPGDPPHGLPYTWSATPDSGWPRGARGWRRHLSHVGPTEELRISIRRLDGWKGPLWTLRVGLPCILQTRRLIPREGRGPSRVTQLVDVEIKASLLVSACLYVPVPTPRTRPSHTLDLHLPDSLATLSTLQIHF